ncbi:MAG: hypothetical protein KC994_25710, partial [Candidatus Omnitrophica bacterium]|nr:hypothetical protein [Candidatus Omnitrophota bacterium]
MATQSLTLFVARQLICRVSLCCGRGILAPNGGANFRSRDAAPTARMRSRQISCRATLFVVFPCIFLTTALAEEEPKTYSLETAQLNETSLEIWNNPSFQKQFAESYMAETEVEPRIENNERSTMQKVLEMIANDEMSKATETIEKEIARDEDASPVFDFTLANLYFQMEEFDKALSSYQVAVEKFPKFRRAWKNM